MRLIDNWRGCHRFLSVRMAALNGVFAGGWAAMPEDLKASAPHWVPYVVLMVFPALTVLARVIDQSEKSDAA